ncbi:MAG TPA: hypothetical protein VEK08_21900, partial [Planctomycetota bacterium]|nr:hypothetical protein [Planctomycetota bacterium]
MLLCVLSIAALYCCAHPSHIPAVVKVDEVQSPAPAGLLPAIRLSLTPTHAAAKLVVRARASDLLTLVDAARGNAEVASLTIDLGAVQQGVAFDVVLQLKSLAGAETGTLRLFIEAQDEAGWPTDAMELKFAALQADGKIYYGPGELFMLRQAHIADLEKQGLITPQESLRRRREYTTYRQKIDLPAPPAATRNVSPRALPAAAITIPGTVKWKDVTGGQLWPVIGMKLQALWFDP